MSAEARTPASGFPRRLWNILGSVRVFFWVGLGYALVTLAGAFILQEAPVWAYLKLYGESWTRVIFFLALDHLYSSWYFYALSGWMGLSLAVCTWRRVSAARAARRPDPAFPAQTTLSISGEARQFLTNVQVRLKREGWRVEPLGEWGLAARRGRWAWWASPLFHLGLLLLLLAGLVKLAAGENALLVLYENQPQLLPPTLAEGLEITATAFDTMTDPNSGRVRLYYTELTARDADGEEQARLEVNQPYERQGVHFYQSFVDQLAPVELLTGPAETLTAYLAGRETVERTGITPELLELELTLPAGDDPGAAPGAVSTVRLTPGSGRTVFPDTPYSVQLDTFYPHYRQGSDGSDQDSNPAPDPAARVTLYRDDAAVAGGVLVYQRHPEFSDPALAELGVGLAIGKVRWAAADADLLPPGLTRQRLFPGEPAEGMSGTWFSLPDGREALLEVAPPQGLRLATADAEAVLPVPGQPVRLDDHTSVAYLDAPVEPITGLEAKRDPGLPLFWAGAALLSLASILIFAVPYRRIWLRVEGRELALRTQRMPDHELRRLLSPQGGEPR